MIEAAALPAGVIAPPNPFAALGLAAPLVRALGDLGFVAPTNVQSRTIPAALAGGDWMVSSQTGSGKTAAFLLPTLQSIVLNPPQAVDHKARSRGKSVASPRVLVLCPTRELAQQVAADAIKLVRHTRGIRIGTIIGGMQFGLQLQNLRDANLVVATPGRLLDLHRNRQISLDQVESLVVDEADRMLDLGFSEDLAAIHEATARRERTLMFSATFAGRIMELATKVMRDPKRIELESAQHKHVNIAQSIHWVDNYAHKRALLNHYLADTSVDQALIFTSTQVDSDTLADELSAAGHNAAALHGAMPQALRNRRLKALRNGEIKLLVATDVAARGIDVPTISHVINFGLPLKPEDYVHRIGRTGRAGRNGIAITLAEYRDRSRIRNIEFFTQQRITESTVAGLEPKPAPKFGGKPAPRRHGARPEGRFSDRAPKSGEAGKPSAPKPWVKRDAAAPESRKPVRRRADGSLAVSTRKV